MGWPGGALGGPDFVPTPRDENRNGKGEAQLYAMVTMWQQ